MDEADIFRRSGRTHKSVRSSGGNGDGSDDGADVDSEASDGDGGERSRRSPAPAVAVAVAAVLADESSADTVGEWSAESADSSLVSR